VKVRYYGHVGERSGYGVAARAMCRALVTAGVELEIRPIERRTSLAVLDEGSNLLLAPYLRRPDELTEPDVAIVHTLPLDCASVPFEGHLEETPWVAYTTWEAMSPVPDVMVSLLSTFDQVWVPSSATERTFMGTADEVTTRVMPHAYDPDLMYSDGTAEASGRFRFLYVGAWTSRKNVAGLLRAWAMAFSSADPVELWIHSAGASQEAFGVALHQTGLLPEQLAKVRLLNEPLTPQQMTSQYRMTDCFVTASRGEAWNLPAFEAMLHRRHVIAPSPAGSDDFLRDTSADLIGGMAVPAGVDVKVTGKTGAGLNLEIVGAQGLTSRAKWLEPDLVRIAEAMRDTFATKRRDLRVKYNPEDRYSYEAVGKLALEHLEDL
jgi:glycosyltransferase involved in cell wall biosynthesis